MTTNEIVGLDKNYMFGRGQLNKLFQQKFAILPAIRWQQWPIFIFPITGTSQWKF